MSATADIFAGVAGVLAAAGVGVYRSNGSPYLSSETAIVAKDMPTGPDRCAVVTPYALGDTANVPAGTLSVQIRFRGSPGSPLDVDTLGDAAFDVLQNLTGVEFGAVHVVQFLRKSSIPLGQDSSNRWMRSDNYSLDVNTPATALRHF